MSFAVGILTVSDTRSTGERVDETTGLIRAMLADAGGFEVGDAVLVADEHDEIVAELERMADEAGLSLVLTTGGTGLGRRDVTPEATREAAPVPVPGLPEAVRSETARQTPLAWLSRATAGLRGDTLVVNLPGSPKGVREALEVLLPLLPHALAHRVGSGRVHHPADGDGPR